MTDQKTDWVPQPGETVYVSSGGWHPVFGKRKVARLTATQIVLEPLHAHAEPERFMRNSSYPYRGDYPSFSRRGGGRGRLYHPESREVVNQLAEQEREVRVNAVLTAQDNFRVHRDAKRAKALQKALEAFLEHEPKED